MMRTTVSDYFHSDIICTLVDGSQIKISSLIPGDQVILIQRYEDTKIRNYKIVGTIIEVSDIFESNSFVYASSNNDLWIVALKLRVIDDMKILNFSESNTYKTINKIGLDILEESQIKYQNFTISHISGLYKEPFQAITISFEIPEQMSYTLLLINNGILNLID